MIRYQKLSYSDAKVIIAEYDSYDDNEFKDLENHWRANDVSASAFDPSYEDFRHELLAEFNSALVDTSGKMTYLLDLRVGIKLFQLMPLDSNFSIIEANNDDIWRYISVKVMPDITYLRYPTPEKGSIRINQ